MDNVQSELGIERTNPFLSSNYLLVQRNFNSLLLDKKEGQHLCFQKKNKVKLDKL